MNIKRILNNIIYYLGIYKIPFTLNRYLNKSSSVIFVTYHRVLPNNLIDKCLSQRSMAISVEVFKQQLEALKRNYQIISMDEYFFIRKNNNFNYTKPYAVICFDDGWADNYLYAFPELKKLSLPATIYLTSGMIGGKGLFWPEELAEILLNINGAGSLDGIKDKLKNLLNDEIYINIENVAKEANFLQKKQFINQIILHLKSYPMNKICMLKDYLHQVSGINIARDDYERLLTWNEVREMESSNISFGSHTATHAILTNIPIEEAQKEIYLSKEQIEQKLGHRIQDFSYPNGSHNNDIVELVKNAGFRSALSGINGVSTFKTHELLLIRKGINELRFIDSEGKLDKIATLVEWSGLAAFLRRLKRNKYH